MPGFDFRSEGFGKAAQRLSDRILLITHADGGRAIIESTEQNGQGIFVRAAGSAWVGIASLHVRTVHLQPVEIDATSRAWNPDQVDTNASRPRQ
jgi:hypothetical protein